MHVLTQDPVDRSGRPVQPETEKQTENILNFGKNFRIILYEILTKYHAGRIEIHDINKILKFINMNHV